MTNFEVYIAYQDAIDKYEKYSDAVLHGFLNCKDLPNVDRCAINRLLEKL